MKKHLFILSLLMILGGNILGQSRIYAPTLLAPKHESVDVVTNFYASWEGVTGIGYNITYDVQLAKNAEFTNPVSFDGLKTTACMFENLDLEQEYFWRVKAIDDESPSSWSEVFSFTTFRKFEVSEPADEAIINVKQKFVWKNPCSSADIDINEFDHLEIEFAYDEAFTNQHSLHSFEPTELKQEITDINYGVTLYWRLRGVNRDKVTATDWSETRSFTTKGNESFYIKSPTEGTIYTGTLSPGFTFNAISGTRFYYLEISESPDFKNVDSLKSTSSSLGGLVLKMNKTYYVRGKARNKNDETDFCETVSFSTIKQFKTSIPKNEAVDFPLNHGRFVWKRLTTVDQFELQITTDEDFSVIDKTIKVLPYTGEYILELPEAEKLEPSTKYYWRVRGVKSGNTTDWSEKVYFTTVADGTQSVDELFAQNNTISIYPNPANNDFKVQIKAGEAMNTEISMVNMIGKTLKTQNATFLTNEEKVISFDVEGYEAGVYFIRIKSDKGTATKKIMIK